MSNTEVTVAQMQNQLALWKGQMELGDAIMRLKANPDFKKVIEQEWMAKECVRYIDASADASIPAAGRADALQMAQAPGHLKRYLSIAVQMANAANNEYRQGNEALDEYLAEQANNGAE